MQFSLNLFYTMHSWRICNKIVAQVLRVSCEPIFCSSVQKRDPSDATLCQDDIVRVRESIKTKKTNKRIKRYMKKTYVSPLMVEVNVEAEAMLAASLQMNGDKTVDTSSGGQLSGGSRGTWGNLWE